MSTELKPRQYPVDASHFSLDKVLQLQMSFNIDLINKGFSRLHFD